MPFQLLIVILAAATFAACARGGHDALAHGQIQLVDCEVPGFGGSARCGTYSVWENREARAGRQVSLNLVILPARRAPARPDPVFYFDGGPGVGATRSAGNVGRFLHHVNEHRDLVFLDVRGTGRSNRLECPEPPAGAPLQEHFREFLADSYVRRCLEHQTADVRFYTQPFAMDDVNDIRAALGYRQINLYGSSGGTRQEQIYMKRHGVSVRSVVMHGVQAMDGESPLPFSRALEDGMQGLIGGCEKDAGCRAAYPHLRADWETVKRRFEAGPVEANVGNPRTGVRERVRINKGVYADGVRHMLYNFAAAREIPAEIQRAARGDFDAFAERELAQSRRFAGLLSHGTFITVTCAEDVRFIDEEDIRRATAGTFLGDYRVRRQQAACRIWPRGEGIDSDFQKPVTLDVPVLLISGEFDVATPPSEAERVARSLPRARHIVFPDQGHNFANPACASRLIADFIESADTGSLDISCVAGGWRSMVAR